MKLVEFFQHWNEQATSCPSLECQIQVQKPILVVATDQMITFRVESSISIDSNITDNIIKKVINV